MPTCVFGRFSLSGIGLFEFIGPGQAVGDPLGLCMYSCMTRPRPGLQAVYVYISPGLLSAFAFVGAACFRNDSPVSVKR